MITIENIHPITADEFSSMSHKERNNYLRVLICDLLIPHRTIYTKMFGFKGNDLVPLVWYAYENGLVAREYTTATVYGPFGGTLQRMHPICVDLKKMRHNIDDVFENHVRFMNEIGADPIFKLEDYNEYDDSEKITKMLSDIYDRLGVFGTKRIH